MNQRNTPAARFSLRSLSRRPLRTLTGVLAVTLAVTAMPLAASASSATDDPIILNLQSPADSTDAAGKPLEVASQSGGDGEERFEGRTASGVPFVLFAQSALPVEPSTFLKERAADPKLAEELSALDEIPEEYFPESVPGDGPVTFSRGYSADELAFDPALLQPTFAFAVTPTTASFAWEPIEGATSYLIVRDGEKLADLTASSYSDTGLKAGVLYEYELLGLAADGSTVSSRTMPVETIAATDELTGGGTFVPLTYQPYTTAFTYKTFIADAYVPMDGFVAFTCGQWFDTSRYFGGDNRSWAFPTFAAPWESPHYRTMLFVNVNWDNPAPYDVILEGGIGSTKLYNSSYGLIETKTATFADSNFIDTYKSGSYAQTHWQHSVGNPFCALGAITYDITVRFYRSGTIEVVGDREPVPHHEAYGRWDNGSGEFWNTMYQDTNDGFICLLGYCTDDPIILNETH